jgi:hypothetical protein
MNPKKFQDNFFDYSEPVPECGCLIWTQWTDKDGYGQCSVNGKRMGAHRAAWTLINGEIPNGLHVLHHCDTPSCVNPRHLFLGTEKDNCRDAFRKKRRALPSTYIQGEKHPKAKLTAEQVIDSRRNKEKSTKSLAIKYGVSEGTMRKARIGETWKSVM